MSLNINKPAALALLLAGAGTAAARPVDRVRWVMGTLCEIEAYGTDADVSAAFAELERWDRLLSVYKDDSELSRLNAAAGTGPVKASAELRAVARLALERARDSGGAFDPTVLPVLRGGPAGLPLVGWRKVRVDDAAGTVELPDRGMGLDFGGIGKGWALDRAGDVLRSRGVRAARLNFGGQVLALGAPPGAAGWEVRLPGPPGRLLLKDASVAVSGDSERPGHIVSPFDGRPVRRPVSVAVLAPTGARADGWSAALYVLGRAPAGFPERAFFAPAPAAAHKGGRP